MSFFLFPDNTVLVNFALVSRMSLLETLLAGHGKWTVTIESECVSSAQIPGLEEMTTASGFLGDAIVPTQGERIDTQLIRAQLAKPGDKPTDHLGEAETFAVIQSQSLSAIFVTDDIPAARLARTIELRTMATAELFRFGVKTNRLTIHDAWADLETLRLHPRTLPHCPLTLGQFRNWCG